MRTQTTEYSLVRRITVLAAATAGLICAQVSNGSQSDLSEYQGRRIALVIGNDAYPQAPLNNAVNDAVTIGRVMEERGFSARVLTNSSLGRMDAEVTSFIQSIQPKDIVLMFYSGHGIQIDGDNFMVPVDFAATNEVDAKYRASSIGSILDRIHVRSPALTLLILDACRNNPFQTTRSFQKGWAAMQGAFGTFIAFATSPGSTASDNPGGRNGLFTEQLAASLNDNSLLSLDDLFNTVRKKVYLKSQARQLPWSSSSVIGTFLFSSHPPVSKPKESTVGGFKEQISPSPITLEVSNNQAVTSPNILNNPVRTLPAPVSSGVLRQPTEEVKSIVGMFRAQQFDEVISVLTAALPSAADRTAIFRLRALAYALIGARSEARADVAAAHDSKNGSDYLTHYVACLVNTAEGAIEDAIKEGTEAVHSNSEFGEAYICLANAYFLASQYDHALAAFNVGTVRQSSCIECSKLKTAIDAKLAR